MSMPSNLTCLPFSDHTHTGKWGPLQQLDSFRRLSEAHWTTPTTRNLFLCGRGPVDSVAEKSIISRSSSAQSPLHPTSPIRDAASVVGRLTTQTSPPSSKQAQALASPTPSWTHPESRHCPPLPHRLRQIAPQGTRGWRPRVLCLPYRSLKLPLNTIELLAESILLSPSTMVLLMMGVDQLLIPYGLRHGTLLTGQPSASLGSSWPDPSRTTETDEHTASVARPNKVCPSQARTNHPARESRGVPGAAV